MLSTAPTWSMSWYGPVIIPSSIFVPEHVNKYSIIRIIRRPVLWKDFAVYDLVVIPLRQRYCKLHVWLKLDLYVKDGSWVNLGISIGLDWVIWRPISTQVTEYPTTSGSWLLRHSERDIDSGIDDGVRHILVLDTFLLLPTCYLEPYDIYYVIWIHADWAVFSLYDLVQRMILRMLSRSDGLSAEVHWKHTNAISCRVMLLPRVKQMSRCRMWIVSKERMMVLSSTRDHRKNVMKPIRVRIALEL